MRIFRLSLGVLIAICFSLSVRISEAAAAFSESTTQQLLQKLSNVEFNLTAVMTGVQNASACADDGAKFFSGERCASMQTGEVNGLRANWGLESTGADLMRLHPAVRMTDTRNAQLAIIDTGLELRGNPSADAKLRATSPELDYGNSGHGTHVAGIAASEKFGVNPGLTLKIMPTYEASGGFTFQGGFDSQQILANIRKAADDPRVKVINMSISNPSDKENSEAIRYAMSKGKWIVNAAGNEGQIASAEAAGLVAYTKEPRFFAIGSLSPFGAPAGRSNYGPTVRYYAPGALIASLNGGYNPNLSGQVARTNDEAFTMSGTSMASPHFAAVLSTLAAMQRNLSADDANFLIGSSALMRGPNRDYAQVNPYLAVTILDLAKDCLARAKAESSASRACLASAEKSLARSIQSKIAKAIAKKTPAPGTCGDFNREYNELRQLYFLSKGDPKIAARIVELLDSTGLSTDFAKIYFAPNSAEATFTALMFGDLKDRTDSQNSSMTLMDDQKRALAFHQGKDIAREQTTRSVGPLQNLHPNSANVKVFMGQCRSSLTNPAASRMSGAKSEELSHCTRYLREAPAEFNLAVLKEIKKSGATLHNNSVIPVIWRAGLDEKDPLAVSIFTQLARGFSSNPAKIDTLDTFFTKIPAPILSLSPADRKKLLDEIESAYARGELIAEGKSRDSHLDPKEAEAEWKKRVTARITTARLYRLDSNAADPAIVTVLGPEDREGTKFDPEVRRFIAASTRAGVTDGAEAVQSFNRLLATAGQGETRKVDGHETTVYPRGVINEYGDNAFNSVSVLRTFGSKKGREAVITAMSNPKTLANLNSFARVDLVMRDMFPQLTTAEKKRVMRSYVDLRNSKNPGFMRGSALEGLAEKEPVAREYLQQIKDGKTSTAAEKLERAGMLAAEAQRESSMNSYVRAFVTEHSDQIDKNVFSVHPSVVIAEPKLRAKLVEQLQRSKTDPELAANLAVSVRNATRDVVKPYLELLHPDIARLAVSGYTEDVESSWLGQAIISEGANPAKMNSYAAQMARLASSSDEMKTKSPGDARPDDLYGRRIVRAVQLMSVAKAGEAALATQPAFLANLADFITDPSQAKELNLSRSQAVPKPLVAELVKRMPEQLPLTAKDSRLPSWMTLSIEASPEGYARGLNYLQQAAEGKFEAAANDLKYALEKYQKSKAGKRADRD